MKLGIGRSPASGKSGNRARPDATDQGIRRAKPLPGPWPPPSPAAQRRRRKKLVLGISLMGTVYVAAGAAAVLLLTRAGVGEALAGSAAFLAAAGLAFAVQVPVTWRDYDVPRERKRVRWRVFAVTVGIGLAADTAVVAAVREFLTFTTVCALALPVGVAANYLLCDFFVLRPHRDDRLTASARRSKRRRVPISAKFGLRRVRWRQAGQR